MSKEFTCDTCGQQLTVHDGDETCARCVFIDLLQDRIWEAFEQSENCYADRGMDVIDTGGQMDSFRMKPVAEYILKTFEDGECDDQVRSYLNGRWR